MISTKAIALLAAALPFTFARTDLAGCTSSPTVNQWHEASMIWYVPSTGEICDIPDCGGGRAPPKHDNPACPGYTGTASYAPSYLPGVGKGGAAPSTVVVSSVEAAGTSTTAVTTVESVTAPEVTVTVTSTGVASSNSVGSTGGPPSNTQTASSSSVRQPSSSSSSSSALPTFTGGAVARHEVTRPMMAGFVAVAGLVMF